MLFLRQPPGVVCRRVYCRRAVAGTRREPRVSRPSRGLATARCTVAIDYTRPPVTARIVIAAQKHITEGRRHCADKSVNSRGVCPAAVVTQSPHVTVETEG